jgi:hypothetical protein
VPDGDAVVVGPPDVVGVDACDRGAASGVVALIENLKRLACINSAIVLVIEDPSFA